MGSVRISPKDTTQMLHVHSCSVYDALAKDIRNSGFYSVLCDGSTDTASLEEEIVYLRYLNQNNKPETAFLCVCDVEKLDAAHILNISTQV